MTPRRVYFVLIVTILIASGALLFWPSPSEPTYNGRKLSEWLKIWDAVCDEADPPDDGPLPSWEIARLAMMPWMDPLGFPSAEYFSGYMRADLIYRVRDLVHAFPPVETPNAD